MGKGGAAAEWLAILALWPPLPGRTRWSATRALRVPMAYAPFDVDALGLTGTASLAEELDKKLLIVLRDGKKIVGVLRSFDQFANIVLEHAFERVIVGKRYADVPLGLYVIRGDNVVLLGQMDEAKDLVTTGDLLTRVTVEEILEAKAADEEERKLKASLSHHLSKVDV